MSLPCLSVVDAQLLRCNTQNSVITTDFSVIRLTISIYADSEENILYGIGEYIHTG